MPEIRWEAAGPLPETGRKWRCTQFAARCGDRRPNRADRALKGRYAHADAVRFRAQAAQCAYDQGRLGKGPVMAEVAHDVLAVTDKRARQLARISMRRLRYWEETGLIVPSVRRQVSPGKTVRLYGFEDLLELLVAAELRRRPGISLQHIRRLIAHLRKRDFSAPLRELKFATHDNHIYVQYPDGSWSGDPDPDQLIFRQAVALDLVSARIEAAGKRDPAAPGKVVKRRGVHGGKPIFAGTRIPVGTVQRYLQAGYSTEAIIEEYPSLTPADIDAARQHAAAS